MGLRLRLGLGLKVQRFAQPIRTEGKDGIGVGIVGHLVRVRVRARVRVTLTLTLNLTLTLTLSVGIVGHLGGVHHDVQPGVARGGEGLREVRVRVRVRVMVRVRARVRVRVRVSRAAAKASANCANPETVGLPEKSMPTTYLLKG